MTTSRTNDVLRMCVVCRDLKQRHQLLRLTVDAVSHQVMLNLDGSVQGRSAYVCQQNLSATPSKNECIRQLCDNPRQRKRFAGALKRPIPDAIVSQLSSNLS